MRKNYQIDELKLNLFSLLLEKSNEEEPMNLFSFGFNTKLNVTQFKNSFVITMNYDLIQKSKSTYSNCYAKITFNVENVELKIRLKLFPIIILLFGYLITLIGILSAILDNNYLGFFPILLSTYGTFQVLKELKEFKIYIFEFIEK